MPHARTKNLFDRKSGEPFKLSRSKLELFMRCKQCFYFDRRLGVSRPSGPPFTLNVAVDALLKKEFDIHRAKGSSHPLMKKYGINAVPLSHKMMDEWRENFKGIRFLHKPTNLMITGAVDDIWVNPNGEFMVVDYKATSKEGEITIEAEWQNSYKRQMEIYQWLLRRNGFMVSDTGYFVYCNGKKDRRAFDGKLDFDIYVIAYNGNDAWVEKTIFDARECLAANVLPKADPECEYCEYRRAAAEAGTSL